MRASSLRNRLYADKGIGRHLRGSSLLPLRRSRASGALVRPAPLAIYMARVYGYL
jgi:hypothetical protein